MTGSAMTPEQLRENYERIWSTTEMRESPDYYARCLALATPHAGERLLDVACGGGFFLAEAERAGLATSGIDLADAAIAKARQVAPKSELQRGDAESLPYPDDSFDIVTCLGSVEHMLNPETALEEMRRVLAPGGRTIVVVPNQWFAYDVARGWLEGAGLSHGQESERYFSITQARDLVGRSFWIRHVEGWNPPPSLARATRPFTGSLSRAALRVYGWLRPRLPLAMAYVFVFVGAKEPDDAPASVSPGRDDVIAGGWHDREGDFSRWTAKRAGVWLRLGAEVRALARHAEPEGRPLTVAITVDWTRIGEATLRSGEWVEIAGIVPTERRGQIGRVYLESERTWRPSDRGMAGDTRDLGVSVQRIWST
jgi:SAM-dependent methyltransferase